MSGRITIDSLSDSLKEMILNSGLSEEEINTLIQNAVANVDVSGKQDKTDNELVTTDKTIVGAINELFQSANNGKELIANAIGEPLDASDTFSAMSGDINGLLATFKTNMMNNGVTVEGTDKFKSLIDKIATLADNEGKGIQYTEGVINDFSNIEYEFKFINYNDENDIFTSPYSTIDIDVNNTNLLIADIFFAYQIRFDTENTYQNYCEVTRLIYDGNSYSYIASIRFMENDMTIDEFYDYIMTTNIEDIVNDGLYVELEPVVVDNKLLIPSTVSGTMSYDDGSAIAEYVVKKAKYWAIGVGEEDTTLRDSLASILEEEGVSVTEEDDMASLIGKVDSEFTKDNDTISGLENDINNGKSIIANAIGTPLTATDTFTEMGSDINGLLSTFKTNMMNNGVTIESGDKFKALIDKIATLADSEGKGMQFASGQIDTDQYSFANVNSTHTFNFNESLNFTPTYLFIRIPYVRYTSINGTGDSRNAIVSNLFNDIYNGTDWAKQLRVGCISSEGILNIKSVSASGFVMEGDTGITFGYSSSTGYESDSYIDWYAIGVGEEDTTLRDSLASILEEEGVDVTEEDDMASLIGKVDEKFSNLNSMLIPNYNILYDHGTLNTNMLGGFNFNKSYTSGSTFTEESDCLKLHSWSTSDTYDYAVSKYTVKPYPYTKLKFTYLVEGMDGSCTYEIGYTLSSVEYGKELVDSKKITTNTNGTVTAEFSLSNNMEPINVVIHGYAPSYADRTAKLYVYKIELL